MHHSIIPNGKKLAVARCTTCCRRFHCPLCLNFKPAVVSKIHKHLEVHMKNAITFKDKKICRCNLNCREGGHFHCPGCNKTIIRRIDMEGHFKVCQGSFHNAATPAAACPDLSASTPAPPVSAPPDSSSSSKMQLATSSPLLSPSTVSPSPALNQQQDVTTPAVSSAQSVKTSTINFSEATKSSSPQASVLSEEIKDHKSEPSKVKCPLCQHRLYKRNLAIHMKRKHLLKRKDITESSHLKSVCVDASNGIAAVQKSWQGCSIPLHAQSKTWGHVHKVMCELEECRQYCLIASGSGLPFTHCEHIRSLEYCTETATEESLEEDVLFEMVGLKFFGEANKALCIKRQKTAQEDEVPLCVEVAFEKTNKRFCFSVYEPALHCYSRLGRVMVTYNSAANTWHCPCARPTLSCLHINISKWHIFQTNRNMFTVESPFTSARQQPQVAVPPPTAEDFKRLVQYLYDHKKLPAKQPDDLVEPKALMELTNKNKDTVNATQRSK